MRQLRKPQETDQDAKTAGDLIVSVLPTAAKAATATGRSSPTTVTVVVAVVQHAAVTDSPGSGAGYCSALLRTVVNSIPLSRCGGETAVIGYEKCFTDFFLQQNFWRRQPPAMQSLALIAMTDEI